jgi:IS5 family transposase
MVPVGVVSLHDTEARPIAKGRLGLPVEFGFKGQVVDNIDGIVLDHCVCVAGRRDVLDPHQGDPI